MLFAVPPRPAPSVERPGPSAQLPRPPMWSLTGMLLRWPDHHAGTVVQAPFRWAGSAWEARAYVTRPSLRPRTLLIRFAPPTRDRWRALALDASREAARQLQEFIEIAGWSDPDLGTLTLS